VFFVHWSKVSKFNGVYYLNVRSFYIGLKIAGVILFFGIYRAKMYIKVIIERKV
jgi:hypothetical protein